MQAMLEHINKLYACELFGKKDLCHSFTHFATTASLERSENEVIQNSFKSTMSKN